MLLEKSSDSPRIWAAPASISLFAIHGWFIGMQNSKTPMVVSIISNVVNVVFSALFTDAEITRSLVIGAAAIFTGMCLVIGNPRDIVNLRNVQ